MVKSLELCSHTWFEVKKNFQQNDSSRTTHAHIRAAHVAHSFWYAWLLISLALVMDKNGYWYVFVGGSVTCLNDMDNQKCGLKKQSEHIQLCMFESMKSTFQETLVTFVHNPSYFIFSFFRFLLFYCQKFHSIYGNNSVLLKRD